MKEMQHLRPHAGHKRRKEGHYPVVIRNHRGDQLPDKRYPSARIARLRAADPTFVSNRQGWLRWYHWQDWSHRRLKLYLRLHDKWAGLVKWPEPDESGMILLYTDYPIVELGDTEGQEAPVRRCAFLDYDGDKYATVLVEGVPKSIKIGYIYTQRGRLREVPSITHRMALAFSVQMKHGVVR